MTSGRDLLFLISQPRAGSTLMQRILGAHSLIHTAPEPWIALHPLMGLRPHAFASAYGHGLARDASAQFLSNMAGGEGVYDEGVRRMLGHIYSTARSASGKPLFLDKTPRYYTIVPDLRRVFPEAHFIVLMRNPMAVFASILENWVGQYYFTPEMLHDVIEAPHRIADAMQAAHPRDAVIRYEDVARDPVTALKGLCQSIGIPFEPGMVEYGPHPTVASAFGDQNVVNAHHRPVPHRAGRWVEVLRSNPRWTELGVAYLHALGDGVISRLGYDFALLQGELGRDGDAAGGVPDFFSFDEVRAGLQHEPSLPPTMDSLAPFISRGPA